MDYLVCTHIILRFSWHLPVSLDPKWGRLNGELRWVESYGLWRHIWRLSDSNEIRTHKHLLCKRTLNHLVKASLAKWLSVRLRANWLWVRILLLSLKLQIWRLARARSSLTFRQIIECRFTLIPVRDMMITYSHIWRVTFSW